MVPSAGSAEVCYFRDLAADAAGQTRALLRSVGGDNGVSVIFNKRLPALLHALEEPPGRRGRLRDRPGAGDQLPQPAIVRGGSGAGGRVGAGRESLLPGHHRGPSRCGLRRAAQRAAAAIQAGVTPEVCHKSDPHWSA